MAKERTIELRFKVDDTGSIKLEAIKGNIDKVSESTTKMGKAMQEVTSRSSGMIGGLKENWLALTAGITAGYFAIQKVVGILDSFISAAAEAEKIESRMAFQIRATGIEYEKVKPAIDDFANSILKSTRFSDEMAREGLGQMMIYTENLTEAIKNTRLAMDMSTQTGMDLESAIRLIGMAMEGNVERLGRYIPQLKHLDKVIGENAPTSEKAAYALRELNKLFAGAAQKDLETYSGSLAQLKNEENEIAEVIGKKLLPWYRDWIAGVKSLIMIESDLTNISEKNKRINEEIVKAEVKRVATEKRGYEEITKYASVLDEAVHGYKILGITASQTSIVQVDKAIWAVGKIGELYKQGKETALNYYNAIKAASDLMKKTSGDEVEQTKKLVDLSIDLEKAIKEISWEDPDRKKKVQSLIDTWIEARGKIIESTKTPIQIVADIAPAEREFEKLQTAYNKYKSEIESNPIKIKIENFKSEGSPSLSPSPELTGRPTFFPDTEANVNFTATGLSPKIPLGDAFTKIRSNFKTMQEKVSAMEATIQFAELSGELRNLQKQYDKITEALNSWIKVMSSFAGTGNILQDPYVKMVQGLQEDIQYQMTPLLMRQAQQKYLMGFPGAEEEFYNLFKTRYSFQYGTDYVPRTGLALIHQGEKIIPANQNHIAMGGITFNINGTQNPKAVAEEIAEILKYKRNGRLERAIQRVR